jgi:hypothetical protein
MKHLVIYLLTAFVVLQFVSCKKEKSYEAPLPGHGSLLDLAGDCMNSVVKGTYTVNKALGDSNFVQVSVRVSQKGAYTISTTNVLNGYSFQGSGVFQDTGLVQVILKGTGVPSAAQTDRFTLLLDSSICDFEVTVLAAGSTSNGSCNATVAGTYTKDVPLSTGDSVTMQHNYAAAGTYNVTTDTLNGYSFKKTITVSAPGNQTITLTGTGTPAAVQTDAFTVKFGDATTCGFSVNVVGTTASAEYFPITMNSWWSYDDLVSPPDTITRTVTGSKAIAGNNYTKVDEKDATGTLDDSIFYRKSGGSDYYEYALADKYNYVINFDANQYGDILFLRTGLAAGASWLSSEYTGNVSGTSTRIRYNFTVINPDATITIGGRTYNNVYQVSMKPEQFSGSAWSQVGETWLFYYAKGVGLIYEKNSLGTGTIDEYQLRNWKIF